MTNKKSICKIKDKSEGKIIDEVVGLKLKMYSIKNIYGKERRKEIILQPILMN